MHYSNCIIYIDITVCGTDINLLFIKQLIQDSLIIKNKLIQKKIMNYSLHPGKETEA